jgi:basic membrane protein A
MTETNVVGFIGGMDIDTINDFRVGYEQGVKDANPDAKVVKSFTGDWSDTNLGAEAAQTEAAQGADIIFCAAGGSGNGAIFKASELGIKCIGVDQDQRIQFPQYADDILCSMVKEVGNSIVGIVEDYVNNGNFSGGEVFYGGLDAGYIGVAYGGDDQEVLVSDEIQAELQEQIKKLQDGELVVDTAL